MARKNAENKRPFGFCGDWPPKHESMWTYRGNRVMKISKQFLIAGAMLCAITTTGAHAVTKCVALNSSTTCTSDYEQYEYHANWAATCTTNGVSTPISGIGICVNTEGGSIGSISTGGLIAASTSDDNRYCWCRMTSPAVSPWVFEAPFASAGTCAQRCALRCAEAVQNYAGWRSSLFRYLSD